MLNQNNFSLNSRLQEDTFILKNESSYYLLLSKNANFLWLILVPKTDKIEFTNLNKEEQLYFLDEMNRYSEVLQNDFKVEKLNIATIGNIVEQLHIHIVGRFKNDICFPNPVWGCREFKSYSEDEIRNIKSRF